MSQIDNNLLINIRNRMCELSPALEKVGRFVAENPEYIMYHTISELADKLETSEGSITRFCRVLGFRGFVELRTALTLGQGAIRQDNDDEETAAVIASVRDSNAILEGQQLADAASWLHDLHAVSLYATGTAVPVALFMQINLMYMGKAAYFIDRYCPPVGSLWAGNQKHGIIAVHTTEASTDMLQMLAHAKSQGVKILSITRGTFSPFSKLSDWNLQAAVSLTGQGEYGFSQIAGSMMVADRLLQALEQQDASYSNCRKAHKRSIFSIGSVVNKLSEYFMT